MSKEKAIRSKQKECFLDGRARKPHSRTRQALRRSFEEAQPGLSSSSATGVCAQCYPVLSRHADTFKGMVHQGTELKKKKLNPYPKRPESDLVHYRDITKQNEWLRENVFDSLGNYLYCCSCIRASLGISKDRIARQRSIKRQSQEPIVSMSKSEVEAQRLSDYIIMPADQEMSFKKWWEALDASAAVEVRYPHKRHGNAGKPSHSAKSSVMDDFLKFVNLNSQPNGRSADSSGPTSYFLPRFTTIQMPKAGTSHHEERLKRSIVGEFNRVQQELGKNGCSNGSSHNWLKSQTKGSHLSPSRLL